MEFNEVDDRRLCTRYKYLQEYGAHISVLSEGDF